MFSDYARYTLTSSASEVGLNLEVSYIEIRQIMLCRQYTTWVLISFIFIVYSHFICLLNTCIEFHYNQVREVAKFIYTTKSTNC